MRVIAPNTVSVSPHDVEAFASRWPCSGLRLKSGGWRRIVFTFDDAGNLVDVEGEPDGADGSAMVALSQDAQAYLAAYNVAAAHKGRLQRGVTPSCSCGWRGATFYGKGSQGGAAADLAAHKARHVAQFCGG